MLFRSTHYRGRDEPPGNGGFLFNGGRLYIDMGHIEFATPECRGLFDLVAADVEATTAFVLGEQGVPWLLARGRTGVVVAADGTVATYGDGPVRSRWPSSPASWPEPSSPLASSA